MTIYQDELIKAKNKKNEVCKCLSCGTPITASICYVCTKALQGRGLAEPETAESYYQGVHSD